MSTQQANSFVTASVSRNAAVALIDAALAHADKAGIEVSIAITDAGGHLKAFQSTDNARFLTCDVAIDKAWTAASYGIPTHMWNSLLTGNSKIEQLSHRPRMVAVGGGHPILENGKLIGGIGISGGNYHQDARACEVALESVGFQVSVGFAVPAE